MKYLFSVALLLFVTSSRAQTNWQLMDQHFGQLPAGVHVYQSEDLSDGKPNRMYYVLADLKSSHLSFTSDTSKGRRLTPRQYFEKNGHPTVVVNAGFFSFETNENFNAVVKDGEIVAPNSGPRPGKGQDSGYYLIPYFGTFGVFKNGRADVAWTYSDAGKRKLYATQSPVSFSKVEKETNKRKQLLKGKGFKKWNVSAAVGGGPVLVQNGQIKITNNEELRFAGKAIDDRHPRTAIGYTKDHKLVIFVCEGRSKDAAGLSLIHTAEIMKELGCYEALNLDGGGSTALLVNGKEVNTPSSNGVQRAVPSVFLVKEK